MTERISDTTYKTDRPNKILAQAMKEARGGSMPEEDKTVKCGVCGEPCDGDEAVRHEADKGHHKWTLLVPIDVREEIAKTMYYQHVSSGFVWENEGRWYRDKYLGYADQVLSIKLNGITLKETHREVS